MAEMIATYSTSSSPGGFAPPDPPSHPTAHNPRGGGPGSPSLAGAPLPRSAPAGRAPGAPAHEAPGVDGDVGTALQPPADPPATGGGYLNEVRSR
jgi:hypothetical protein